MKIRNYKDAREWLKQYRLIEKELVSRTEYIEDFKRILLCPLPDGEITLNRIYKSIISHLETDSRKLRKRLQEIERVLDKLKNEERSVIYHRYIRGVNWLDMPEIIMYEQRTCQFFEMQALKKIAKMNIDWEGKGSEFEG